MSARVSCFAASVLLLLAAAARAQEHDHSQHAQQPPAGAQPPPAQRPSTDADRTSEREHIAPDPPAAQMPDMPYAQMTTMMGMDDRAPIGQVVFDESEWQRADSRNAYSWDAHAWFGNDYTKLWLTTEGERRSGVTENADAELLVDRIVARWWSVRAGVRHDFGEGPQRDWVAVGVQGIAPYFFDVAATAYVGEGSRAALRVKTDYDLLLTQRLILRPSLELNLYSKNDAARGIGSGLSSGEFGLRLRYELRREFAPYIGLNAVRRFGKTRDYTQAAGDDATHLQWVAGVRFWF